MAAAAQPQPRRRAAARRRRRRRRRDQRAAPQRRRGRAASRIAAGGRGSLAARVGLFAPPEFLQHLTVFVLACFVGWQVVWNVTPALHTPLMSVTNAISGIILIGGMLQMAGGRRRRRATALGARSRCCSPSINVAGGFLVTQRMLRMFRK